MEVWKENKQTGLSCGINDFGELFLGNKGSGYNLPDSHENGDYFLNDFNYWNEYADSGLMASPPEPPHRC